MRRIAAAMLLIAGAWIAHTGLLAWWVDREVIDPDRLAETAVHVVSDDEFLDAFVPEVTARLANEIPGGFIDEALVDALVRNAIQEPEFKAQFQLLVVGVYDQLVDGSDDPVTLDIASLTEPVAASLDESDPALADEVRLVTPEPIVVEGLPDLGIVTSGVGYTWLIAVPIGLGLVGVAVLVHPRHGRLLRRAGLVFLIGAALQVLGVWLVGDVIVPNLPGAGLATAIGVAIGELSGGLVIQAIVQGALAAMAIVAGQAWMAIGRFLPIPAK